MEQFLKQFVANLEVRIAKRRAALTDDIVATALDELRDAIIEASDGPRDPLQTAGGCALRVLPPTDAIARTEIGSPASRSVVAGIGDAGPLLQGIF
jgi:hypothetical protein